MLSAISYQLVYNEDFGHYWQKIYECKSLILAGFWRRYVVWILVSPPVLNKSWIL